MSTTQSALTNIVCLALLTLFSAFPSYAQTDDEVTRGLKRRSTQNADALAITLFTSPQTNGQCAQWTKVDPSTSLRFKSGDCIRLSYRTNVDAYIYFMNVDKTGTRVIEPELSVLLRTKGRVKAFEQITSDFELDDVSGREEIVILMAANPIPKLNEAIQQKDSMLDSQTTSLPTDSSETIAFTGPENERTRGLKKKLKKLGIIIGGIGLNLLEQWTGIRIPIPIGTGAQQEVVVQPRSLDLQAEKGSVVAAPEATGDISSKKLISGQVVVMRISFDHVDR